ncbi:MAG: hypothetical protein KBC02_03110 [Candidatus Pacebacteria bacterium]|jgi:hypothetical protein|nr:hypothetical protein [Candidatus Paceibacterota bacterium]
MTKRRRLHHRLSYFTSSFATITGVVLVWRGVWYGLDWLEKNILPQEHWITLPLGVVLGFFILYLPDRNLEEIRKL